MADAGDGRLRTLIVPCVPEALCWLVAEHRDSSHGASSRLDFARSSQFLAIRRCLFPPFSPDWQSPRPFASSLDFCGVSHSRFPTVSFMGRDVSCRSEKYRRFFLTRTRTISRPPFVGMPLTGAPLRSPNSSANQQDARDSESGRPANHDTHLTLEICRGRTEHPLRPVLSPRFLIGSSPRCDLRLGGAEVPPLVAMIFQDGSNTWLEAIAPAPLCK